MPRVINFVHTNKKCCILDALSALALACVSTLLKISWKWFSTKAKEKYYLDTQEKKIRTEANIRGNIECWHQQRATRASERAEISFSVSIAIKYFMLCSASSLSACQAKGYLFAISCPLLLSPFPPSHLHSKSAPLFFSYKIRLFLNTHRLAPSSALNSAIWNRFPNFPSIEAALRSGNSNVNICKKTVFSANNPRIYSQNGQLSCMKFPLEFKLSTTFQCLIIFHRHSSQVKLFPHFHFCNKFSLLRSTSVANRAQRWMKLSVGTISGNMFDTFSHSASIELW